MAFALIDDALTFTKLYSGIYYCINFEQHKPKFPRSKWTRTSVRSHDGATKKQLQPNTLLRAVDWVCSLVSKSGGPSVAEGADSSLVHQ